MPSTISTLSLNLNEYAGTSSKAMGQVPKKEIFSDVIAPKKEIISLIEQATQTDIFLGLSLIK